MQYTLWANADAPSCFVRLTLERAHCPGRGDTSIRLMYPLGAGLACFLLAKRAPPVTATGVHSTAPAPLIVHAAARWSI